MIGQNEYYDGQVRSLEFHNEQGNFTVGVMEPGEWRFEAPVTEWMLLVRGSWDVQQPAGQGAGVVGVARDGVMRLRCRLLVATGRTS